ncbi:hypothetical protein Nepgr_006516 [Nepenthes gracilis]|uniref:Uncharacterized protein n=1 Tax=Nepenthes gracilis TaxID=150966 RepID=A0AAD3S5D5_NEPGR|nr:hypothetical protein Nepgr_006516 [Nepenthes gracilis]
MVAANPTYTSPGTNLEIVNQASCKPPVTRTRKNKEEKKGEGRNKNEPWLAKKRCTSLGKVSFVFSCYKLPCCPSSKQKTSSCKWRPKLEEEYEDQEGNIYNKKTNTDLQRQGLI